MSKNNNVNPDHYKVAGRERPGNAAAKAPQQPQAVNRNVERAPGNTRKKKMKSRG